MIADFGVELPDGKSQLGLEKISPTEFYVVMHEGRHRQIRRTFAALGYEVAKLHRLQVGGYLLGALPEGGCREV